MQINIIVLVLVLIGVTNCDPSPPVWPERFTESFLEYFDRATEPVVGMYYYDSVRNYTRVDRSDGRWDRICGSIIPNVSTDCSTLVRDHKRYIIFPTKRFCCMCCDAAHGCDVLSRNWL